MACRTFGLPLVRIDIWYIKPAVTTYDHLGRSVRVKSLYIIIY